MAAKYPIEIKQWGLSKNPISKAPKFDSFESTLINFVMDSDGIQKTFNNGEYLLCALVEYTIENARYLSWIRAEELFLLDVWRLVKNMPGQWEHTAYCNELPHYEYLLPPQMYSKINADIIKYNELIRNTHTLVIDNNDWKGFGDINHTSIIGHFILDITDYDFHYADLDYLKITKGETIVKINIESALSRVIKNKDDKRMKKLFYDVHEPAMFTLLQMRVDNRAGGKQHGTN